jgi:hypothetical protein
MLEVLQPLDDAQFIEFHQVMAGIIALIGMESLGKPIVGEAEFPT